MVRCVTIIIYKFDTLHVQCTCICDVDITPLAAMSRRKVGIFTRAFGVRKQSKKSD